MRAIAGWPSQPAAVIFAALTIASSTAVAQLRPDRTYYGIDRPIPMTVTLPDAPAAASGDDAQSAARPPAAHIRLLAAPDAHELDRAPAREGSVDLAALFPALWEDNDPRVMYAQLVVGDEPVGPGVVLQPLLSPAYAPRVDRAGAPMFPPARERPRVYSGIRAYVDHNVVFETSLGNITIALRPDAAPNTCWRFRELVAGGMYTDVIVHRVASLSGRREPDIVQTGDPNGNGQGGSGEFLDLEPGTLAHDFGVVSMARFADPNSASSQFMIGLNREGTAYLDKRYAAFGQVIAGADVLRAIAAVPVGADNRPLNPPVIHRARLAEAAPYGQGPGPEPDPARRGQGR